MLQVMHVLQRSALRRASCMFAVLKSTVVDGWW